MPRKPRSLRAADAPDIAATDPDATDEPADALFDPDSAATPSKSALKRQMHALQALGERLLEMPPGRLAPLPLSDTMREALAQYHRIRRGAREGRRRQAQLIGKLMRSEDTAGIAAHLDSERDAHRAQGLSQQMAAQWRDRLVQGGAEDAEAFQNEHGLPGELRDLIQRARREFENDRPPQAQRLLYRRILKRFTE